jgi:hypothetical protein
MKNGKNVKKVYGETKPITCLSCCISRSNHFKGFVGILTPSSCSIPYRKGNKAMENNQSEKIVERELNSKPFPSKNTLEKIP